MSVCISFIINPSIHPSIYESIHRSINKPINAFVDDSIGPRQHLSPDCAALLEKAKGMVEFNVLEDPLYGVADDYDEPEKVPVINVKEQEAVAAFSGLKKEEALKESEE